MRKRWRRSATGNEDYHSIGRGINKDAQDKARIGGAECSQFVPVK